MLSNQVALGIFFLYFVLMSGTCSEIMNCGLQRYIKHNNWIKHLMIFLSIYIFTFILNWYTLDSLIVENFNVMNFINEQPYLKRSLYYSIIIYVIFILSTKNEGKFLATFLFGSLALVFGTIYTKTINTDIFKDVQKKYITMGSDIQELKKKYSKMNETVDTIAFLQNTMNIIFSILFLLLVIGSYRYYLRQYQDHKKNWNWLIFWFGSNKCRHL